MNKTTKELEGILLNHPEEEIQDEMLNISFGDYFRNTLLAKNITQQTVFLNADIGEKYGYKLISGEKHTKQRDVIIRLCFAGEFTFNETH